MEVCRPGTHLPSQNQRTKHSEGERDVDIRGDMILNMVEEVLARNVKESRGNNWNNCDLMV